MKQYRQLLVGAGTRDYEKSAEYFTCGDDTTTIVDFWMHFPKLRCELQTNSEVNVAEMWVRYQYSGIPLLIGDYTCDTSSPRSLKEIQTVYGPNFTANVSSLNHLLKRGLMFALVVWWYTV